MNKAYKFRMYPSSEQKIMLARHSDVQEMVFNHCLDKRIKLYQEEKITFGYTKCTQKTD